MKFAVLIFVALGCSSSVFAQSDFSQCRAARIAAHQLSKIYIANNLNCSQDSDCSEVSFVGGPACGGKIVSKLGLAGLELLKAAPDYIRLSQIVQDEDCGPEPLCSSRPPGEIKCSTENLCVFQPSK